MKISDPDVRILAGISQAREAEYASENAEWLDSLFASIKKRPSRQVGAIGEKLVAGWLAARGFNVSRSGDSEADRVVERKRVEIKFSTKWAAGGYKFQQLRDQRYDLVLCLGVSPFHAHCWVIPKSDVLRLWKDEHRISSRHGGASGADTAWIDVNPESPPGWLVPHGGVLADGIALLAKATGYQPPSLSSELDDDS